MKTRTKALINLILALMMFGVNALGSMGFINGMSQKDVSDKYMTLITPGPSTFSIWGVIYSLLLMTLLMMIFRDRDSYWEKVTERFSTLFQLSFLVNMAWIVSFSYELLLVSVILIILLLSIILIMARRALKIQRSNHWLLPCLLGTYGAWLFIASLTNVAAWLVQAGWNRLGYSPVFWTAIILVFAIVCMILMTLHLKNALFPAVWIWALYGIYSNLGGQNEILNSILLAGMALSAAMVIIQFTFNQWKVIPIIYHNPYID